MAWRTCHALEEPIGEWSRVRVLDAPSLLLLGVDTMRDFEPRINFSTSVAQSGCPKQDAHLQSMGTGHWAIDL